MRAFFRICQKKKRNLIHIAILRCISSTCVCVYLYTWTHQFRVFWFWGFFVQRCNFSYCWSLWCRPEKQAVPRILRQSFPRTISVSRTCFFFLIEIVSDLVTAWCVKQACNEGHNYCGIYKKYSVQVCVCISLCWDQQSTTIAFEQLMQWKIPVQWRNTCWAALNCLFKLLV